MLDFESKKRQILDRVDILALVGEFVALRRSGKRWVGLCPFHTEKTPSFSVSPEMGIFKCFGCGKGGDVFSFVQFRENIPFVDAMRFLADRAGVVLDEPRSQTSDSAFNTVTRLDIGRACAWAASFFQSKLIGAEGQEAREYLASRGFQQPIIEKFGLGLAVEGRPMLKEAAAGAGFSPLVLEAADLIRRDGEGRYYETFRNRLMFPIRDASSKVIGFGGRTLVEDKAKYLNTRQNALFDKGRNLFGIDLARQSIIDRGRAIVVEGYTDCMACHQAGFTEAVASLGTALTETHVDLIRRYAGELVLVFDSDQAGIDAADRALRVALPRSITVRLARVPEGKDPGEFLTGPDANMRFMDLLKGAVEALEFTWRQTWARYHEPTSDGRRREAILDFVRMVSDASKTEALDPIRKGFLTNQLAHLLRLDRAEVASLMASTSERRMPMQTPGRGPESITAPVDSEQSAWVRLLEVLLNEPGLLGSLDVWPDPARIVDARDRRVAQWVFESARNFGDFTLADVLAFAKDGDDASRIAELATRGQARGNYETSMRVALDRLKDSSAASGRDDARRKILESPENSGDELTAYADGIRRHRHFGPLRMVRRVAEQTRGSTTATKETSVQQPNSEPL